MSKLKTNKIITLTLIITFIFSPALAIPARAQWVVWDPGNFVPNSVTAVNTSITAGATFSEMAKDFGLDAIGWIIAKLIIERMSASTVNWINSGFHGSPAFVTDPQSYFQNIGDKIAGQYIFSNPNLNFLCGPISAKIRLALAQNYVRDRQWQCTLTQVGRNMDDFMSSFENGGWDNFFELTQKQQNNPIGAYLQAENELNLQIATRQGTSKDQLNWGQGFMSFETCKGTEDPDGFCNGRLETQTPGSVIANQLNKQLGAGTDTLVTADEINEIISALLSQLVSHVVGGIGSGLRGLTSSDSSNGGQSYTTQLTNSTASGVTDYFGNTQDTSILSVPPPDLNYNLNSGVPTSGQVVTPPQDNDCNTLSPTTLNAMAQSTANQQGISISQAMQSLDCPPTGIH